MFKIIAIVVGVLIITVLIFSATRPDTFRVQRSANIKAPPEKLFALMNDFHQWEAWSPWEKVDPAVKRVYSGASRGKGAVYEWNGNNDIGQGRIEIVESLPPSKVVLKIDFIKPIEAHNTIELTLATQGDSTTVTQAMYGPSSYVHKLMGVFCSMDKMVGEKYEEGFANLKSIVEQ
jgi:uncharacterized protein YndB with AHSA1/START domain